MTPAQQSSLAALKAHLTCALCAQPYGRTTTSTTATSNTSNDEHEPAILMACMHTFCRSCITTHMENDWQCPLPNCRKSVTNFGGSTEVIKTNPIYSAVSKSLAEIERIMASAPDYWWLSSQCNTANNSKIDNDTEEEKKRGHDGENVENEEDDNEEDEDEMEVVDFTHTGNNNNSNQGTNNNDNDDNNNTNDESSISKCKEHTTTTAFRTSFPPSAERSEYFIQGPGKGGGEEEPILPEFSSPYCSPIPIRGSELTVALPSPTTGTNNDNNDEGEEDNKEGTATASQLDRILHHNQPSSASNLLLLSSCASKLLSSSSSPSLVVLGTTSHSTPTTTAAHTDNKKKRNGVTFQTQPKILPLIPTSKWNTEHSRQLRKWITNGRASLLHISSIDPSSGSGSSSFRNDGGGIDDEGGYNFDAEGVAESFLSLLSSSSSSSKNDDDDDAAVPIMSYYAISTKKDPNFSFDKSVIVVPRSFMYYLVVACGLPIVDVDFLSAAVALNKRGRRNSPISMSTTTTTGGQRYPFPTNDDPYFIQGATNHTWGAPIKARLAALERYTMWRDGVGPYAMSNVLHPGTDLLCKYIVILIGDYDPPAASSSSSQQIRGKRKRGGGKSPANKNTKNAEDDIGYRTRGNISILLRLCGAMVFDVSQIASSKLIQKGLNEDQLSIIMNTMSLGGDTIHNNDDDNIVPTLIDILDSNKRHPPPNNLLVMVKDESDIPTVGHKFVNKIMKMENNNLNVIPIVSSDWLFNSIGEFQVQNVS
jgi:hypothetical protein